MYSNSVNPANPSTQANDAVQGVQNFFTVPATEASPCLRMAYRSFGDPLSPHWIVCVHGLTRQCRDFDILASALVRELNAYVLCTDVVGRGESDWLQNPAQYSVPTYTVHHLQLLRHLCAARLIPPATLDWIGTSMGGLIGMGVAAVAGLASTAPTEIETASAREPKIARLVLNDVAPRIDYAGIARIAQYVGKDIEFADQATALAHLRTLCSSFGPHTEQQWQGLNLPMLRSCAPAQMQASANDSSSNSSANPIKNTTSLRLHYDPRIALPFAAVTPAQWEQGEALLWQAFDAISAEILLLRGAESDLVSAATVAEMRQRKPSMQVREFAGVGHAPTLVQTEQVAAVIEFLRRT